MPALKAKAKAQSEALEAQRGSPAPQNGEPAGEGMPASGVDAMEAADDNGRGPAAGEGAPPQTRR